MTTDTDPQNETGATAALSTLGRWLLVAGLAGTGVLGVLYADFDPQWQHVPHLNFDAAPIAYANAAILIIASAAMVTPFARLGGGVLAGFLLLWIAALHVPRIIAGEPAAWLGPFEVLAVACGAVIATSRQPLVRRTAQALFGVSLLVFGAAHFIYLDFTAQMIPAWIPAKIPLAAFTGAGHIAAGLAIVSGILAAVAAPLLALMFTLFVLLLHIPRVLASPTDRIEWTMLAHAIALTGAAWLMAGDILAKRRARA